MTRRWLAFSCDLAARGLTGVKLVGELIEMVGAVLGRGPRVRRSYESCRDC